MKALLFTTVHECGWANDGAQTTRCGARYVFPGSPGCTRRKTMAVRACFSRPWSCALAFLDHGRTRLLFSLAARPRASFPETPRARARFGGVVRAGTSSREVAGAVISSPEVARGLAALRRYSRTDDSTGEMKQRGVPLHGGRAGVVSQRTASRCWSPAEGGVDSTRVKCSTGVTSQELFGVRGMQQSWCAVYTAPTPRYTASETRS